MAEFWPACPEQAAAVQVQQDYNVPFLAFCALTDVMTDQLLSLLIGLLGRVMVQTGIPGLDNVMCASCLCFLNFKMGTVGKLRKRFCQKQDFADHSSSLGLCPSSLSSSFFYSYDS